MLKVFGLRMFLFLVFLTVYLFVPLGNTAQNYYWVAFTDKNNSPYSLSAPEEYLSERAISRRIKQNIPIDSLDLPVNSNYIDQVLTTGLSLVHASKWLNGITIRADSSFYADSIMQMPFVKEIMLTKPAPENKSATDKFKIPDSEDVAEPIDTSYYGASTIQIAQLNGQYLHNQDFRGEGMHIAVLDAGFLSADIFPAFDSLWMDNRVLGTKDFVDPTSDFFNTHYHGMSVLSCMAGDVPGELIGAAPDASYWLIRSEDADTEYIIEEDNWVVAAEFADSVGADVINSSLGYTEFDDPTMNHTYQDMDGHTTRVTLAANIAVSRGILVFSSAGNERNKTWKYIIAPSDGDDVIAVGAVDMSREPASFTSLGPASDGDVKPNVSALGSSTFMQRSSGNLGYGNGTSFASPVMAGMGACLWQAHPNVTAKQVKQAIEQSASLYPESDLLLGYGIPDMKMADQILKSLSSPDIKNQKMWFAYPNPVKDYLIIQNNSVLVIGDEVEIAFFTIEGRLLLKQQQTFSNRIFLDNLNVLPDGLIILKIKSGDSTETLMLSKIR